MDEKPTLIEVIEPGKEYHFKCSSVHCSWTFSVAVRNQTVPPEAPADREDFKAQAEAEFENHICSTYEMELVARKLYAALCAVYVELYDFMDNNNPHRKLWDQVSEAMREFSKHVD
jgi:hypothetical protein